MEETHKIEKHEIIDLASEYLVLCRRWRGTGARLSEPEVERLLELRRALESLLGAGPPRGVHYTLRKGLRVPLVLEVRFRSGVEVYDGRLVEIAEEGVFIATSETAPPGTRIRVELINCDEVLEGDVVRIRGPHDPSGPPGIAIHLKNLTPTQGSLMLDLVEGALSVRLGGDCGSPDQRDG